jgi:hypothetical protein
MKVFAFAVLAAAWAQPVFACDLCSIYSASQGRGEAGSGVFAGVAEQFTYFGTVQVDGHKVSNPSGQYLDSSVSQVFAGYNFSDRFGLQFNVPVIYRYYKRPDSMGGIQRGTESGLGDASILGTFVPFRKSSKEFTFNLNILGGVKFPTGGSDRIAEELHEVDNPVGPPSGIHGHDLTRGTGSYDGIIGTGVYIRWRKSFLSASVQYTIRSKGDFDYRFANDLTWSGGPGYSVLLNDNYSLAVQGVVSGEDKGTDTFRGEAAVDTGVTAAYLAVDLPMSIENTSLQTVPDYRIRAGVTWRF